MNDTCTCGHERGDHIHGGPVPCEVCPCDCFIGIEDTCEVCGHDFKNHRVSLCRGNGWHCICATFVAPYTSPKPKLKMQLILLGESSMYVKVEEVDARWKSAENGKSASFATDFFTLYSGNVCELLALPLHRSALRLFKGEVAKTFVSRETRSAWIDDMEDALKEWSENWEGFKTCSPSCTNHCPPPQPARVEKEDAEMQAVTTLPLGGTLYRGDIHRIKVINYTVY